MQTPTGNTKKLHKVSHGATAGSDNKSKRAKDKYSLVCYCCGGKHLATKCCFISKECCLFGKRGQIAKVCRSTQSKSSSPQKAESSTSKPVHQLSEDPCGAEYTLYPVQTMIVNHYTDNNDGERA